MIVIAPGTINKRTANKNYTVVQLIVQSRAEQRKIKQSARGVYHVFLLGRNVTLTVAQDSAEHSAAIPAGFIKYSPISHCVPSV
jgi:hypothetical protein